MTPRKSAKRKRRPNVMDIISRQRPAGATASSGAQAGAAAPVLGASRRKRTRPQRGAPTQSLGADGDTPRQPVSVFRHGAARTAAATAISNAMRSTRQAGAARPEASAAAAGSAEGAPASRAAEPDTTITGSPADTAFDLERTNHDRIRAAVDR